MASKTAVLLVEDDIHQLSRYKTIIEKLGYEVKAFTNAVDAKAALKDISVEYAFIDIHLSPTNDIDFAEGLELVSFIKLNYPEIIPISMSNDPNVETYKNALKVGAAYYIKKPILNENELAIDIENAKAKFSLTKVSSQMLGLNSFSSKTASEIPDGIVISDELRVKAKKIAFGKSLPVVIYGETGTGKEEFAKLIFRRRCEIEGPIAFVSVNCANIDENMAASLFFGHVKGAFTGAITTTDGYIGAADGGILFLDEIHALSKNLQQRLLRVLNDGTYERLGDAKLLRSKFQVIAATTKDLDEEVEKGNFILDLRGRLIGRDIKLLPLRERKSEIPFLISLFLARDNVKINDDQLRKLSEKCAQYYWQGNIRMLQRAIQTLVAETVLCGEPFDIEALPVWRTMLPPSSEQEPKEPPLAHLRPMTSNVISQEQVQKILAPFSNTTFNIDQAVEYYEKTLLGNALAKYEKLGDAATAMGITRASLDGKRKKYSML